LTQKRRNLQAAALRIRSANPATMRFAEILKVLAQYLLNE